MAFAQFRQRLERAQLDPEMREVCLALTDLLSRIDEGDGYHLGLPFFAKNLSASAHPNLLPALSILSTMEAPILSMNGYLDAEDGQHHLTKEEFEDLIESGKLAHPDTGDLIAQPLEHVRIFYSIRDEARDES
jgi:hypothetical protein